MGSFLPAGLCSGGGRWSAWVLPPSPPVSSASLLSVTSNAIHGWTSCFTTIYTRAFPEAEGAHQVAQLRSVGTFTTPGVTLHQQGAGAPRPKSQLPSSRATTLGGVPPAEQSLLTPISPCLSPSLAPSPLSPPLCLLGDYLPTRHPRPRPGFGAAFRGNLPSTASELQASPPQPGQP